MSSAPTEHEGDLAATRPIVVFDGVCNLCNSSVDFIMRHDRDEVFLFTASQDEAGGRILAQAGGESKADSVFLWENGQLHERSAAIVRIARLMPLPWRLAYAGVVVPSFLRNLIYDWVAGNRYRWFGQKDTCRIPTTAERARFLP